VRDVARSTCQRLIQVYSGVLLTYMFIYRCIIDAACMASSLWPMLHAFH